MAANHVQCMFLESEDKQATCTMVCAGGTFLSVNGWALLRRLYEGVGFGVVAPIIENLEIYVKL